tara:strand:+ start:385 stop:594 length:210 start_codon:yes stop_codon:yes gene_type:complete
MEIAPDTITSADETYDQGSEEQFRFGLQDIISSIVSSLNDVSNGVGGQSLSTHSRLKHVLPPVGIVTHG